MGKRREEARKKRGDGGGGGGGEEMDLESQVDGERRRYHFHL